MMQAYVLFLDSNGSADCQLLFV